MQRLLLRDALLRGEVAHVVRIKAKVEQVELATNLLLIVVAEFNASEILFYQGLFDFHPVFQQDVEHGSL